MPVPASGARESKGSVFCRCSGDGEEGGELRGDDPSRGVGGVLSRALKADEAAREKGNGTGEVSWSVRSVSELSDGGTDGAWTGCEGAAASGLVGRDPWGCRAPFGSSDVGDAAWR
jgi:hypothetical protein